MTLDFPDCETCHGTGIHSEYDEVAWEQWECEDCDGIGVVITDEMVAVFTEEAVRWMEKLTYTWEEAVRRSLAGLVRRQKEKV